MYRYTVERKSDAKTLDTKRLALEMYGRLIIKSHIFAA